MIKIVDYGLGNIQAFANVYKQLNIPCAVAEEAADLQGATRIILPGVGAFDNAMQLLQKSGMRTALDELVMQQKVPVLGICLGMQILAGTSEEGNLSGLGWIDGEVKKFDASTLAYKPHLPHMGWNNIRPVKENSLLEGLDDESRFYFLHSYYFQCVDDKDIIAVTDYGGEFACAVNRGNIYGVQFHPEKSHQNGIMLLENFGKEKIEKVRSKKSGVDNRL